MNRIFATVIAVFMAMSAFSDARKGAVPQLPWKTKDYTLVAHDMNLRTALDTFAVAEGLSIVMSAEVQGTFSGSFKNVPCMEFLEKIATAHNLIWYYDGAALYVYAAGEVAAILVDLKYMKSDEVGAMLADLGVEDPRFPIKTTSGGDLIMVSGPPRYVALVAELIAKADKLRESRTYSEIDMRLFPLVHTWADDVSFSVSSPESTVTIRGVARLLEEIMATSIGGKNRESGTNTVAVSAAEEAANASFRPVIRPENRINAVVVRDVASRMDMYARLIKQLDIPQKLVEIDVTVVELSRKDALDWQLSLRVEGSHKHVSGAAGQNAGNLYGADALGGKGLAGALSYLGRDVTLAASLTALKEKGKARSISRTSLLTVNNLAAQMRDNQSYHVRVVGKEVATLEEVSAGTTLQVKPRIVTSPSTNVSNQIWLSLRLDDGGFESISVDSMPMTRSSTLETQTAVFEEESIMLAGYLRDIEEDAGWGIPYLRDIPWIGWLFGGKSTRKETVQRMFILTPRIVDLDEEMLARLQSTRLRDITEMEKMEDDAQISDDERRRRDLERKEASDIRSNKAEIRYQREKAEFEHRGELRKIERGRIDRELEDDIREWKAEEEAKKKKLELEESEKKNK